MNSSAGGARMEVLALATGERSRGMASSTGSSKRGSRKLKHRFGDTFVAKRHGRCRTCGNHWEPGDYICAQPGGGTGHAVCPGIERTTYNVTAPA